MPHSNVGSALSNVGIFLLERQCYQQAWDVLHDAVHLVCGTQVEPSVISAYIQEAQRRQSRPEPSIYNCPLCLQVISDHSDSTECIHATNLAGSVTVLRFEAFEPNSNKIAEETDGDSQVTMAAIVYNYAVATLFIALTESSLEMSTQLLQNSLRCMLRCQEVFATVSSTALLSSWELLQKVYTLALVSTQGLLSILYCLGPVDLSEQIQLLHHRLATMRETLARLPSELINIAAASA